jgi:hypothetical protein
VIHGMGIELFRVDELIDAPEWYLTLWSIPFVQVFGC